MSEHDGERRSFLYRFSALPRLIFGRTTLFVLILLVQVVALFGGFFLLGEKVLLMNYFAGFVAMMILIYVVNSRRDANMKMTWIILILAVPIFGVVLFIYTRIQPGTSARSERMAQLIEEQRAYLAPARATIEEELVYHRQEYGIFKYIYEGGNYPSYMDPAIRYFPLGEDKFEEMLLQLRRAKDFIFMEYFIIEEGYMWDQILSILSEKAKAGVEVRLMYDGTCELSLLPKSFPKKMEELGINCKVFSPMVPFMSTHQNNRDHRKILVIDGRVAFTGGVNLADEYINRKERFGHWKDTAIMVEGKCVDSFTLMFLQMWNTDENRREDYVRYIVASNDRIDEDENLHRGGMIAPYGESPLDDEAVGEKVYMDIISKAEDYVHIMTPYLILSETMVHTLIFAAQRGIDVKLILPHIPDKKYAYWLARTHYYELITGGVKIYEYTPGFVHAKVFCSDDVRAVVGTINLDYRSLYLHFECAAYIYDNPVIGDIARDFDETLTRSERITIENCRRFSPLGKVVGKALKIVAPLM